MCRIALQAEQRCYWRSRNEKAHGVLTFKLFLRAGVLLASRGVPVT